MYPEIRNQTLIERIQPFCKTHITLKSKKLNFKMTYFIVKNLKNKFL